MCLNAERVIGDCLESVASQSVGDVEHIIIDGASTDRTLDVVRSFPHIAHLSSGRDDGLFHAMNKSIDHATGDYILFLNADDRLAERDTLQIAKAEILARPKADIFYGKLRVRPVRGAPHTFDPPAPTDALAFLVTGCLPHQSTFASPDAFRKIGRFDTRYKRHADYDWFLRAFAQPDIAIDRLQCLVGSYHMGGLSSDLALGQPEFFKIQNQAAVYQTPQWTQRRIQLLQAAYLQERLRATSLPTRKRFDLSETYRTSARQCHAFIEALRRHRR